MVCEYENVIVDLKGNMEDILAKFEEGCLVVLQKVAAQCGYIGTDIFPKFSYC